MTTTYDFKVCSYSTNFIREILKKCLTLLSDCGTVRHNKKSDCSSNVLRIATI